MSLLNRQKLVENATIQRIKCDFSGDFQLYFPFFYIQYRFLVTLEIVQHDKTLICMYRLEPYCLKQFQLEKRNTYTVLVRPLQALQDTEEKRSSSFSFFFFFSSRAKGLRKGPAINTAPAATPISQQRKEKEKIW